MDAPRRCTQWPEDFNRSDEAQHDSRNCSKPGVKSLELIAFQINLTLGGLWVSDIPLGLMTRIYYMGHWWAWPEVPISLAGRWMEPGPTGSNAFNRKANLGVSLG